MDYKPKPEDTADVKLPEGITDIIELLAKNTHEVWADGKMKEGYHYGTRIDTKKRTHPSLRPYEDLPESQKEYDRNTLLETIKLLIKLGYKIEKGD